MNAFFYPRLALSGMRRARRIYAPYLAACVFMTAVVYDLAFLADSPALYAVGSGVNGMGTSAIRLVMPLGKWVMAVFALLFFFYTNAFLIRRRKKELGLMSVLGMDRGALTSLLFWETAFSALVSLTAGLALGVLLTQLSARVLSHFARTELPALPLLDLGAVRFCVLTDAFIRCDERHVRVLLGGFLVVVAGADLRNMADGSAFSAGDQADFGVHLVILKAINDLAAGFFHAFGPVDVVLLV